MDKLTRQSVECKGAAQAQGQSHREASEPRSGTRSLSQEVAQPLPSPQPCREDTWASSPACLLPDARLPRKGTGFNLLKKRLIWLSALQHESF